MKILPTPVTPIQTNEIRIQTNEKRVKTTTTLKSKPAGTGARDEIKDKDKETSREEVSRVTNEETNEDPTELESINSEAANTRAPIHEETMPGDNGETRVHKRGGRGLPSEQGEKRDGKPEKDTGGIGNRGNREATGTPEKENSPNDTEDYGKS